jgi:two-component system cell cycle sensor histidine kinase/response regulator CckA
MNAALPAGSPQAEAIRILMVEDSADDMELLLRHLRQGGLQPSFERVQTREDMQEALAHGPWDLVISDYSMPTFDGISAYTVLRESGADIPFIFVSGNLGEETAVEAMRLGVSDYFVKGKLKRLVPAIQRELRKMEDRRRRHFAEEELRSAEEQLRQSQKMEAVGRLAGGVAHDFNNLLTVIFGHTDLLLEGGSSPGETQESLEEIRRCAERAADLTRKLLAFSRRQVLQRRPLALNTVVADVTQLLLRLIGEDIVLQSDLGPDVDAVEGDPGQLDQVLMNLVINARDAMPHGGKISIRTANAVLGAEDLIANPEGHPGPHVLLEVEDNGEGIEPETLTHIFEPFFTTKEAGKGTGLGLATVYGIVRQSGGHIAVRSEMGTGTRFRIYLPRSEAAVQGASPALPIAITRADTETILLTEDEPPLREFIELVLRRRGFQVLSASNASEALAFSQSFAGTIDLLLTDVTMPGMDGRELARLMQHQRPGIKVLFMTGYAHPQLQEAMERGESSCIMKPFSSDELARGIRKALGVKGI